MSQYLEEAAAQLRAVAEAIEKQDQKYPGGYGYRGERARLATQFMQLAAIDKGLLPVDLSAVLSKDS